MSSETARRDEALFLNQGDLESTVAALRALKAVLERHEYERTDVLPLPGGIKHLPVSVACLVRALGGRRNLFHRSCMRWPIRAALRLRRPQALALHDLFLLGRWCDRARTDRLLSGALVAQLTEAGVVEEKDERLRSRTMIVPYAGRLYLADPFALKRHAEYVYIGRTSLMEAEILMAVVSALRPAAGGRLLDLGCGCGILGLSVASRFEQVVGTDIVDRCVDHARLNAALNGAGNCRFIQSDLYARVEGTFDVIATNPPCSWSPEPERGRPAAHGGGDYGFELPARVLAGAFERLNQGGFVCAALTGPIRQGRPYVAEVLERIYGNGAAAAEVRVHPLFEEFAYRNAAVYADHGISATSRYLAVIRPAPRFSLRFERLETLLFMSYRLTARLTRLAAAPSRLRPRR